MRLGALATAILLGVPIAGCTDLNAVRENLHAPASPHGAVPLQATEIRLPNGLICRWEPGPSANGPYACGAGQEGEIRLAAPPLVGGSTLRATINVLTNAGARQRRALVAGIEQLVLADGTICRNAGTQGPREHVASPGFYCQSGSVSIIRGELEADAGLFVIEATLNGRSGGSTEPQTGLAPVAAIILREHDGVADTLSMAPWGGLRSGHF